MARNLESIYARGLKKGDSTWDPFEHGISVSLMKDWMACRELAMYRVSGLREKTPSFALTYGIIVHDVMQRVHAAIVAKQLKKSPTSQQIKTWVKETEVVWRKRNTNPSPRALQNLELSLVFADAVLPIYYEFWKASFKTMAFVSCEEFFRVPMELRHGKVVPFIGKYDAVFQEDKRYWLLETKTKSRIDEESIGDMLPMDFQSNSYLVSLRYRYKAAVAGSVYNVIRRPGLRQGKAEGIVAYANRCAKDVDARPDFYFLRYRNRVVKSDLDAAEAELVEVMTEVTRWWDKSIGHYRNTQQCESKYGSCAFLPVCARGDLQNFVKRGEETKKK